MIAEGRLPSTRSSAIASHSNFETGIELGHRGTESLKVTLTP